MAILRVTHAITTTQTVITTQNEQQKKHVLLCFVSLCSLADTGERKIKY